MSWWETEDGGRAIGDGPADAFSLATRTVLERTAPPVAFETLLAAFVAALAQNPANLVSDPAAVSSNCIVARLGDGSEIRINPGEPGPDPGWIELYYAALDEAAMEYREAYERKPTLAELLETFAFTIRAYDEIVVPGGVEHIREIAAEARAIPTGPDSEVVLLLPETVQPEDIARVPAMAALRRDPDLGHIAIPDSDCVSFASWSGAVGDRREVDFHHDPDAGATRLEVRGPGADVLADALAAALGGRRAPAPEAALADLLTPPSGAPVSATGTVRWEMLRAAVAAATPETMGLIRALLIAGLHDPDWRVRMAAVLATGRLKLGDLAEQAFAAPVPETGTSGLGQEERRMLLALRHAARNLALGLDPADSLAGEPGEILDRRVAYQRRLRELLERPVTEAIDPAATFVAILLGDPSAEHARLPRWAIGKG